MVIWYIFPRFVILYQEKSGNPGLAPHSMQAHPKKFSGKPDTSFESKHDQFFHQYVNLCTLTYVRDMGRGAVVNASASRTEDPESNPAEL
jgi:hypothetical protein